MGQRRLSIVFDVADRREAQRLLAVMAEAAGAERVLRASEEPFPGDVQLALGEREARAAHAALVLTLVDDPDDDVTAVAARLEGLL